MADTVGLSTEEYGAYRLLLDAMWLHRGWLPDDDRELQRVCRATPYRWSRIRPRLTPLLIFDKGLISQKRLLKERAKISHRTSRSSEANISQTFSATASETNGLDHANATGARAGAEKTITIKKKEKRKDGAAIGSSLGIEGRSEPSPEKSGDVAPRRRTSDWDLPPSPGPYGQTTFLMSWKPRP
jgi:uncharacterized protein YdaU (DUF1376 family)